MNSLHFSQAETPLIADTIGALDDLISSLKLVRDDVESPNVVRVAACAAIMVAEKYYSMTDDCEVYALAIVMSPDKKLQWFRDRQWSEEEIQGVKDKAIRRWEQSYKQYCSQLSSSTAPVSQPSTSSSEAPKSRADRWKVKPPVISAPTGADSIHAYLSSEPMSPALL